MLSRFGFCGYDDGCMNSMAFWLDGEFVPEPSVSSKSSTIDWSIVFLKRSVSMSKTLPSGKNIMP